MPKLPLKNGLKKIKTKHMKKLFLFIFIILAGTAYAQQPTRGALSTLDTTINKPTIKMLAVNVLDNAVVFWNLSYWATIESGSSSGVTSVGLSVPSVGSPFLGVSGTPVTTSGTLALSALGTSSQIVLGDGSLGSALPTAIIPTWQQTLTSGSTLTQDNSIILSGFDLEFQGNSSTSFNILGVNSFGINDFNGTRISASQTETQLISPFSSGRSSVIDINTDSLWIKPSLGNFIIDTINNETFQNVLMGWTSSGVNRGKVGYITIAGSLSLSSGVLTGTGITGLTVGTTTIASGTIGGVIFQGAGNVVQQDATNLFWDDTNNRLGVGTNAPANTFDALSSGTAGRFKSSGYSSSTLIIEDPDGTTYITNGQFRVNNVPFVLNANASYLSLQTAGVERINVANAGDITLKGATIYAIPVTTGVDLSGGQYNAADAGLYHITVGDVSNAFNLPDAAAMTGKTVKIIMKVGDSSPITSSGGSVFDKLGSALSTITGGTYTFTSDGTDWWEF